MTKKPHELEFINQVAPDGKRLLPVRKSWLKCALENPFMKDENYTLTRLSITHDTYIASEFNTFIVKLIITA